VPEQSRFAKSLSSPWQWLALAIIFITLVLVAIGPKVYDRPHSHQNALLQCSHGIGLAMYAYANDNNGKYPTGNSSTEVFQKLVDRGYVTAPSIFYTSFVGIRSKSPANSNKLKPENVCWDVTVPADMNVSDPSLPLVFTTGYRIEYLSHGRRYL